MCTFWYFQNICWERRERFILPKFVFAPPMSDKVNIDLLQAHFHPCYCFLATVNKPHHTGIATADYVCMICVTVMCTTTSPHVTPRLNQSWGPPRSQIINISNWLSRSAGKLYMHVGSGGTRGGELGKYRVLNQYGTLVTNFWFKSFGGWDSPSI